MNILQVLPELKVGGVETGVIDLTKELVKKGHKSVVISAGGGLVTELKQAGGIHYELSVDRKNIFTVISLITKICSIIDAEKIDVIHARSRVPAFSSFFAAYFRKLPFITTCHGYYSKHIFSRVMAWGKAIIVPSQAIAKHMIEDFNVPRERIKYIPRGVDLDKYNFIPPTAKKQKAELKIGVVGRITPIKGHKYFIKAMSKVVRSLPNVKAYIIGEPPKGKEKYENELKTLINRLSLYKYVNFLGRRSDVPDILKDLDLLVLPSTGPESFGRVIIEAQASGVPVIATKVGGVIDIIKHEKNGLLVEPYDFTVMAQAIIRLLKDRELAVLLSRQGRLDVENNFNLLKMYKKTIRVYEEVKRSFSVLIIKLSALGDVVLSIPSIAAIRKRFPKARIAVLVGRKSKDILSNCPYVDEIIIFDDLSKEKIKEVIRVSSRLRRNCFDMIIDLQNNRTSRLLGFMSVAPRRIGYRTGKFDFLLTEKVYGAGVVMAPVEHQFKLLEKIGIKEKNYKLELFPAEVDKNNIEKFLSTQWLSDNQQLVGINIGSSRLWETKRWGIENFNKLCRKFSQKDIRVVLTGAKEDTEIANKLVASMKSKPINMVGKTSIMELTYLIMKCKLFITGDSAPLHIACAVSTPCIALFGPTDPRRHLQPSDNVKVIYKKIQCAPCYRRFCNNIKCMQKISVEEVYETALQMLGINIKK